MGDIFSISLSKKLEFSAQIAGLPLFALMALAILGYFLVRWILARNAGEVVLDSAEFGFGDSKFTLKPNREDRQIAYAIWVELSTRKIGLEIDPENDVISEIYDSWYSFFSVTRELIKEVPVGKLKNPSTQKIIGLSIEVLNSGLRPHLTIWQARFRHWYEKKLSDSGDGFPQDFQKDFPDYEALTADLLRVNAVLIRYRQKMYEILHGPASTTEQVEC